MNLFDGLYLYEVVMLFLGVFLFVVLVLALVYQLMHKRNLLGLLAFFVLSIAMVGYPSIKSIQVQKDGVSIQKAVHDLQSDPAKPELRAQLQQEMAHIAGRPIANPKTLTSIASAQFALGDEKAAAQTVHKALQKDPKATGAHELESKIEAAQKLDAMADEVEKHPDSVAAKAQLQQTIKQASQQPTANAALLGRIAKAEEALGQREEATKTVQKALKINPNLAELKKVQDSIVMHVQHGAPSAKAVSLGSAH